MPTDVITTVSNQHLPPKDGKKRILISWVRDTDDELDGTRAWFVCVCCALAGTINLGSSYSYGLFFPSILDEFQAGKAATALVGSITVAISCLLAPLTSKLCDRLGCRIAMIFGGLVTFLALLSSSFAPNVYVLFLSYGLGFGCASCSVYVAAIQIVPLYFHRHRSFSLGIVNSGTGAGLLVVTPVVKCLLEHFDWRTSMKILAAVNLAPCILGCSINRKRNEVKNTTSDGQQRSTEYTRKWAKCLNISLLTNRMFLLICLTMSVGCFAYIMPSVHLAKYAEDLGVPISRSSWMYFTIGISSLVSRLLTGKLCDTGWIAHIHIFQFAVLVFGVVDFLLPVATNFSFLLAYSVTYGACEGIIMTSMHSLVMISFPMGFGWYMAIIGISYSVGPVLAGLIADLSGSYHPAFVTAGILFFISACLPLLTRFIHKSDKPEEIKLNNKIDDNLLIFETVV